MNRCHGDGFSNVGTQTGAIKLVMAGGANFLHCWITDSIWLECAESLKLSNSFDGGAFTNFRVVLHVNNSLVHSWPIVSLNQILFPYLRCT